MLVGDIGRRLLQSFEHSPPAKAKILAGSVRAQLIGVRVDPTGLELQPVSDLLHGQNFLGWRMRRKRAFHFNLLHFSFYGVDCCGLAARGNGWENGEWLQENWIRERTPPCG